LATTQNAAVLAAQMQVEIARYDRQIARSGHLPTLGLVGKYGFDSQGGRFGETENTSKSIGVELQVPIFSGGGVIAQTNIAEHKVAEAEYRADAERRRAGRTAKEAFRRMLMSTAQASAARKSLESSAAARNALQAQYDSGSRTVAELLEAEKNIYIAKKDLSRAHQQYILNSLKLRVASGTLAASDITHVDSLLETPGPGTPGDDTDGSPGELSPKVENLKDIIPTT
jgi:outer membrane protein